MGERMGPDEMVGSSLMGHLTRYRLAAGFLEPDDTVLDAACGTGYGSDVLLQRGDIEYWGVDRTLDELIVGARHNRRFLRGDLTTWQPTFDFDVFVGFETVEHLTNYDHYLRVAKRASRLILLSVPVIPTVHMNPWHLHDFEPGELPRYVEDEDWQLMQALGQPSEFSEIYIFMRRPMS